jgi:hypothetical protein
MCKQNIIAHSPCKPQTAGAPEARQSCNTLRASKYLTYHSPCPVIRRCDAWEIRAIHCVVRVKKRDVFATLKVMFTFARHAASGKVSSFRARNAIHLHKHTPLHCIAHIYAPHTNAQKCCFVNYAIHTYPLLCIQKSHSPSLTKNARECPSTTTLTTHPTPPQTWSSAYSTPPY